MNFCGLMSEISNLYVLKVLSEKIPEIIFEYKKMMKETLISNFQCSKIQSILSQKGKTISNTSINK